MYYGTVPVQSVSRVRPIALFCQDLDRSVRYLLSNAPEILKPFFISFKFVKLIWFSWPSVTRDIC
jgi:hypothetical protein